MNFTATPRNIPIGTISLGVISKNFFGSSIEPTKMNVMIPGIIDNLTEVNLTRLSLRELNHGFNPTTIVFNYLKDFSTEGMIFYQPDGTSYSNLKIMVFGYHRES